MTISQVLKFCEKKEMQITRGMIQNYIRAGVMPPPIEKRFYTHKHIAVLAMIENLKTVFEISKIKEALSPHTDEEGLPLEIYFELIQNAQKLMSDFGKHNLLLKMACASELKGACF
jgi:DNA-binding transcriptional MerR regulator